MKDIRRAALHRLSAASPDPPPLRRRRPGSVATIDRFFGSLKHEFASPLLVFKPLARARRELDSYRRWFNAERGHSGLKSRTPEEVFAGRMPRKRANPKKRCGFVLTVDYIDGLRSLPVFRLRRAG